MAACPASHGAGSSQGAAHARRSARVGWARHSWRCASRATGPQQAHEHQSTREPAMSGVPGATRCAHTPPSCRRPCRAAAAQTSPCAPSVTCFPLLLLVCVCVCVRVCVCACALAHGSPADGMYPTPAFPQPPLRPVRGARRAEHTGERT